MKQFKVNSIEGRLILLATILASGMTFLIGSAVNIAIPKIQSDFQSGLSGVQWVINAFALVESSLLLISGSLGDRFGRKRVFQLGTAIFIIACFLSSLSRSLGQLISFQALEGLGAAMMIPGSLSIINTTFEEGVRGRAIGLWSGLSGGIATLGPLLGGWLVQNLGWQAIFLINVPLGLLTFFVTLKYVPESKNPDAKKIDLAGTVLITISLLGMVFGLMNGPGFGWTNPVIMASLFIGVLTSLGFLVVEKKVEEPLVPLDMFKSPLVAGANIATLLLYFALSGLLFILVLNLQQVQGYSPSLAGLALLPPILIITFLSGPAGSLSDKIGPRLQMIISPLAVSLGMFLLSLAGLKPNYYLAFLPGLILFGLGMAFVIAPLTKSALAVESKYSGAASGVNNAVARIAGLLAVAILGSIAVSSFKIDLNNQLRISTLNEENRHQIISQSDKMGGIQIPSGLDEASKKEAKKLIDNSFIKGYRSALDVNVLLTFLAAVAGFILIKNKKT